MFVWSLSPEHVSPSSAASTQYVVGMCALSTVSQSPVFPRSPSSADRSVRAIIILYYFAAGGGASGAGHGPARHRADNYGQRRQGPGQTSHSARRCAGTTRIPDRSARQLSPSTGVTAGYPDVIHSRDGGRRGTRRRASRFTID